MTEETSAPPLVWEIDSTHPDKGGQVREALRQVVDPEIGLNIIELGLVRQATLSPEELQVTMILTTPFCPYGPALLEMTRAKAAEAAGVPAKVELAPDMWDPSMMEAGAGAAWGLF